MEQLNLFTLRNNRDIVQQPMQFDGVVPPLGTEITNSPNIVVGGPAINSSGILFNNSSLELQDVSNPTTSEVNLNMNLEHNENEENIGDSSIPFFRPNQRGFSLSKHHPHNHGNHDHHQHHR